MSHSITFFVKSPTLAAIWGQLSFGSQNLFRFTLLSIHFSSSVIIFFKKELLVLFKQQDASIQGAAAGTCCLVRAASTHPFYSHNL